MIRRIKNSVVVRQCCRLLRVSRGVVVPDAVNNKIIIFFFFVIYRAFYTK